MELDTKIAELKKEIQLAKKVTFLTGAGVSTHSGIPDYRSKNGIYQGQSLSPERILSEDTLFSQPDVFYDFVMHKMYFPDAKPNLIHQKIAEIVNQKGTLITQNIDGLDQKAGNQHVIEFHGNLYNIYCTKCQKTVSYQEYTGNFYHQNCGGIIRPKIVLYGEAIDPKVLQASVSAMQSSDLVIIVGTSFVVYPFAQLLAYKKPAAKVWAINKTQLQNTGINQITEDARKIFSKL